MDNTIPTRFTHLNDYWSTVAGSNISEVIEEEDTSEDYETHARHLYKLENGRFAVVSESGCSCYSMSDADVTTYDTLDAAKAYYDTI